METTKEELIREIIIIALSAILGGGGICGIVFYFVRRSLEKKLTESEKKAESRKELKIKRFQVEDELQLANGRVMFWLCETVQGGDGKEHLSEAFKEFERVEEKKKELDRKTIAELQQE